MAFRQDILLDDNSDLLIVGQDFVIGNSDEQHIEDILSFSPNSLKQFPIVGVNISSYYKTSGLIQQIGTIATLQFKADKYDSNVTVTQESDIVTVTPNITIKP